MTKKPSEITSILRDQLESVNAGLKEMQDEGVVIQVGDGVVRVYGLMTVALGELVLFEDGTKGIAMNLEEDNVGVVLIGESRVVKEGSRVKVTGQIASINAGYGLLGRVINVFGEPIDGRGGIEGELFQMPLERKCLELFSESQLKSLCKQELKLLMQ